MVAGQCKSGANCAELRIGSLSAATISGNNTLAFVHLHRTRCDFSSTNRSKDRETQKQRQLTKKHRERQTLKLASSTRSFRPSLTLIVIFFEQCVGHPSVELLLDNRMQWLASLVQLTLAVDEKELVQVSFGVCKLLEDIGGHQ